MTRQLRLDAGRAATEAREAQLEHAADAMTQDGKILFEQ